MSNDKLRTGFEKINCDDIRKFITVLNGNVITPNEEQVDIHSVTKKIIPVWESKVTLDNYENVHKVYLDIETTAIDNNLSIEINAIKSRLIMIGIRNEKGRNIIIRDDSEIKMLNELFQILARKKPDLLLTFNGVKFDLPFLHYKAEQYGIRSPFWICPHSSNFAAATIAGRPWDALFNAVYCTFGGKKTSHIDLYQLAIGYDSILRKFTKYSLKSIPLQMGLRKEERLDLGMAGIEKCIAQKDWDTLTEYLEYDLEDTELLANALMPSLYYQLKYFPEFTCQQLVTLGNAIKWGSVLESKYGKLEKKNIKLKFEGALTKAVAGVHFDVAACDFSGQYPSCMLQYGIHSEHDPDMLMLGVMKNAVDYRNGIKYKQNITQQDKDLSTAVKPLINSAYGSLASESPFGDSVAAATVTFFARARIKWAWQFVESLGGQVVLSDTDSVYVKTHHTDLYKKYSISQDTLAKLPPNPSEQLLSAVAIIEELKRNIPSGSKLDLENVCKVLFIPPQVTPRDYNKSYKFKSINAKKFIHSELSDSAEVYQYIIDNFGGEKVTYTRLSQIAEKFKLNFPKLGNIKKTYIKIEWNEKKQEWKLSAKGRYVKRDGVPLEKEFQKNYLMKLSESRECADDYFNQILIQLVSGQYPVEKLSVTRKIRENEVKLISMKFGKIHDEVSFYVGDNGQPTMSGKYDINHYCQIFVKLREEILCFIDKVDILSIKDDVKQLSIF